MANSKIFVASQTFNTVIDGRSALIAAGVTRVREGHPLLDAYPGYFRELDVHYDVEDTSARPGHARGGNRRPAGKDD